MPDLRHGKQVSRLRGNRRLDGMREMREYSSDHEVCENQAHTGASDEALSGTRPSSVQVTVKEYGDAGRLEDIFLVLPEL